MSALREMFQKAQASEPKAPPPAPPSPAPAVAAQNASAAIRENLAKSRRPEAPAAAAPTPAAGKDWRQAVDGLGKSGASAPASAKPYGPRNMPPIKAKPGHEVDVGAINAKTASDLKLKNTLSCITQIADMNKIQGEERALMIKSAEEMFARDPDGTLKSAEACLEGEIKFHDFYAWNRTYVLKEKPEAPPEPPKPIYSGYKRNFRR